LLHLVGFFYIALPTLLMHGQTQIKITKAAQLALRKEQQNVFCENNTRKQGHISGGGL
jgi:hypothetical protein